MIKFKENKGLKIAYANSFMMLGGLIVMVIDISEQLLGKRLDGIFNVLICLAVLMTVSSVVVLLFETGIIRRKR